MAYSASSAIQSLNSAISSFESNVSGKISDVRSTTHDMDVTMSKLFDKIEQFRQEMMKGEDMQIAQENLIRIDQVLKEQFGNHSSVRRTVMGIIRDCDINLVRNSTIQELSEELWVTSSRYWLSYALISITAWVNNYRETAENALMECCRRDPIKSCLFFCLMNMRFERVAVAKKWFYAYMRILDPKRLQRETAVLLAAFLNGLFENDKELEQNVLDQIDSWVVMLRDDPDIVKELQNIYYEFIVNLTPEIQYEFQTMAKFCSNAGDLQANYRDCTKMPLLLEIVKSLAAGQPVAGNYKKRLDKILLDLISNYDEEELVLKKQQLYFQCVIDKKGDMGQAEKYYAAMKRLQEENYNIGKQMIGWAIYDKDGTVEPSVRKFGFIHTREWFKGAVDSFIAELSERLRTPFLLNIDGWTFESNGEDQNEQLQSMNKYFEDNKLQFSYFNGVNFWAIAVLLISVGLAFVTPWALIATAVSVLFLVYRFFNGRKLFESRRNAAMNNLKACQDEITEYRRQAREKLDKKDEIFGVADFM